MTSATREVSTPDGAVLHVEGGGSAPSALFLNGLGYASWAAEPLRAPLAGKLALVSLDNRGTGRSSRGTEAISIDRMATDAAIALASVVDHAVPVIGFSMGGYIAQRLAVLRPDLVSALVLIGTSAGGPTAVPVPESTTRAWAEAAGLDAGSYAARTMPLSFRRGWPDEYATDYTDLLAARVRYPTSAEVWREQFEACARFLETGYDNTLLTAPLLVLHGGDDRIVPVENGRALHKLFPRARYREVDGAGHLLHIEQPELVAAEIAALLSTMHPHEKE